MDKDNAIEVKNITKDFKVYYDKGSELKEKMLFWKRNRYEKRHVLNGISFNVKRGEAIGLVGKNGCGKSTTLKMLTKIIYPDSGTIEMRGRVSSLIELGAGFHPDMSGRENIYTNAAIFGLSKREIEERLDTIIEFSELQAFIDNPVRTYSSGMYMRLAFAVAINVNADILLIDEILAVGDANFQAKCFDKLKEIKERGTTIIIVSHALGQIEQICDRTIWLQDGQIKLSGTPRDVHPKYQNYMNEMRKKMANENMDEFVPPEPEETEDEKRYGDKRVVITEVEMQNAEGKKQRAFTCGEPITIQVQFHVNEPVEKAMMGFGIFRRDGMHCYGCNTHIDNIGDLSFKEDGTVRIRLEEMDLLEGSYSLDLAIQTDLEEPIDFYREVMPFELYNSKSDIGVVRIPHSWELEEVQKE